MKKDQCRLLIPKRVTQNRVVKFDKVMWSNQGSESDATWKREDYLKDVYPTFIQNLTLFKPQDEIFIRGEGCNKAWVVQQQGMEVLGVNLSPSVSFKDRFAIRP